MAKNQVYICTKCDAQSPKWSGRCLECGAWGTLEKQSLTKKDIKEKETADTLPADIIDLGSVKSREAPRHTTGIGEIDRVFGGGLVAGSIILLGGEPGIGKSTIVSQIAKELGKDKQVIYVSGEESLSQVKLRLERLKCDLSKIKFIAETNIEKIIAAGIKAKPELMIIDSVQTVYSDDIPAEPGSVSQIRAGAAKFMPLAKKHGTTLIMIGHITKDGALAGPKSLEHLVDTVIYLETDPTQAYRFLRSAKNRFGSTNELGIFEMTGQGLKEVKNPSSIFLEKHGQMPGSVLSAAVEGTRPFLVEVQALVSKTVFGYPQRKASGFDLNRLQVLASVITKRTGVKLHNQDVILNVVGGLKLKDPGLDLAVFAAIMSSAKNIDIGPALALGEVGLGGEIRPVARLRDKLKEAEKLGIEKAFIPKSQSIKSNKIEIIPVSKLSDLSF